MKEKTLKILVKKGDTSKTVSFKCVVSGHASTVNFRGVRSCCWHLTVGTFNDTHMELSGLSHVSGQPVPCAASHTGVCDTAVFAVFKFCLKLSILKRKHCVLFLEHTPAVCIILPLSTPVKSTHFLYQGRNFGRIRTG